MRVALSGVLALLCVTLLLVVMAMQREPTTPSVSRGEAVVAALPFWYSEQGSATVMRHQRAFSEVSPWMYGLNSSGEIVNQVPEDQSDALARDLGTLRRTELRLTPTLANMTNGRWSYESVERILHDRQRRQQHIDEIVRLVLTNNYAGIDLDYEELRASDRQAFTTLVRELAAALHAHGKILSVALFAKTSDEGYDERNAAQDYAAIGEVADQVRLMGYDRHWSTSPPGPVAPRGWIKNVLRYAKANIPPEKIILGIPLYGYDWSGGRGKPVSWVEATRIAREQNARVRFDRASGTPWFRYTDGEGQRHEVWFENAESSRVKFRLATQADIGGIYLWMFGPADPETWANLRRSVPATRSGS